MKFEEFYTIELGMPKKGLPSFVVESVDDFGRIMPLLFGTIVPTVKDSVLGYDVVFLTKKLTEYLQRDYAYNILKANVIMGAGVPLAEDSVLGFFDGRFGQLGVASGLSVGAKGEVFVIHHSLNNTLAMEKHIDHDLVPIINGLHELVRRVKDRGITAKRALHEFKIRFPDAVRKTPTPEVKPAYDFDTVCAVVDKTLHVVGHSAYCVERQATFVRYTSLTHTITINQNRVAVINVNGQKNWTSNGDKVEALLKRELQPIDKQILLTPSDFARIVDSLDSSVHEKEYTSSSLSSVLIAFQLDSKIQIEHKDMFVKASFWHSDTHITLYLEFEADVDSFIEYMIYLLSRDDTSAVTRLKPWIPYFAKARHARHF